MPPVIRAEIRIDGRVKKSFLKAKRYHEKNSFNVSNIQAYESETVSFEKWYVTVKRA